MNAITKGHKRLEGMTPSEVQRGSRGWWSENPMAYDWHGDIVATRFTREWFDRIDAAFTHGARLFAPSFDRIIPLARLAGRRVLEIGCGMGFHSELLAGSGADLTSIDLSPTSIEATRKRLEIKGLKATVFEADAEALPFDAKSFDFIWSWGVIHHSSRTARVIHEIARVIRPNGECRVMVYNRHGMPARLIFVKDYLLKFGFLRSTYEETLYRATDGFSARYYVKEQFEDSFRAHFENVSSEICGQDADVIPLPRQLREIALSVIPEAYLRRKQAERGAFIFLKATDPI